MVTSMAKVGWNKINGVTLVTSRAQDRKNTRKWRHFGNFDGEGWVEQNKWCHFGNFKITRQEKQGGVGAFGNPPLSERIDRGWGVSGRKNRISNRGRKKDLLGGVLGSGGCTVHGTPFAEWKNATWSGVGGLSSPWPPRCFVSL